MYEVQRYNFYLNYKFESTPKSQNFNRKVRKGFTQIRKELILINLHLRTLRFLCAFAVKNTGSVINRRKSILNKLNISGLFH